MLIKTPSRATGLLACLLVAGAAAPQAAGPRDAMVTTTTWLAAHLKDKNLVILTSGQKSTYDAGHIPGAQYLFSQQDISATPVDGGTAGLQLEMPDAAHLAETLQQRGITRSSTIVVYPSGGGLIADARLMFTLEYAGLRANTRLLEGGLRLWASEGRAVTTDAPTVSPSRGLSLKTRPELIADAAFVQTTARTAGFVLVDTRPQFSYDGSPNPNGRGMTGGGHIPGAISVSVEDVVDLDGKLRPADELTSIFSKAGIKPDDTVVGYCALGQAATVVLVAAETVGHKVKLYDGSMEDWSHRKLPLEKTAPIIKK